MGGVQCNASAMMMYGCKLWVLREKEKVRLLAIAITATEIMMC